MPAVAHRAAPSLLVRSAREAGGEPRLHPDDRGGAPEAGSNAWIEGDQLCTLFNDNTAAPPVTAVQCAQLGSDGTLMAGFGRDVNGSGQRLWLDFRLFQIQPTELVKVFLVLFLAAYLEEHREMLSDRCLRHAVGRKALAQPFGVVGQNDVGRIGLEKSLVMPRAVRLIAVGHLQRAIE